jgi:CubicO group peptidase (beta-lactamase class C family)
MSIEIHGRCDPKFQQVGDVFQKNFEDGLEVGASVAITLNGELVVDLWAGLRDESKQTLWEEDTITLVFSSTKIPTALVGLMLVDQGKLDIDLPVAHYWPEFAARGKDKVLVRHCFTHSAGVPTFDPPIPFSLQYDWDAVTQRLADQALLFEPGNGTGYHGATFGFLLGELIRRITGMTPGQYLKREITSKVGIDFHIGATKDEITRMATIIPTEDRAEAEEGSLPWKSQHALLPPAWEGLESLTSEQPAVNGMGNGRSLAELGAILAMKGKYKGVQFLSEETIDLILTEQFYENDRIVEEDIRFGFGLGLNSTEFTCPSDASMHWGGAGGSFMVADCHYGSSIGYVMNRMLPDILEDPRNQALRLAYNDVLHQIN